MQNSELDLSLIRDILSIAVFGSKPGLRKLNYARPELPYHLETLAALNFIDMSVNLTKEGKELRPERLTSKGREFLDLLSEKFIFQRLLEQFGPTVNIEDIEQMLSVGSKLLSEKRGNKSDQEAPLPPRQQQQQQSIEPDPIDLDSLLKGNEPNVETESSIETEAEQPTKEKIFTERETQIRIALKRNPNFWWMNANPDIWRMSRMKVGDIETYSLYNEKGNPRNQQKSFLAAKAGDLMLGYETGRTKKVQALFEITEGAHGSKGQEKISFRLLQFLPEHPTWADVKEQPAVSKLTIAKQQAGSLFDLNFEAFSEIMTLAGIDMDAIDRGLAQFTEFKFRDINSIQPAIGVDALSVEIASLIANLNKEPGMMVGIFGRWGRGKTYLFNLVWDKLAQMNGRFTKAEFHAWKYQDTEASWAYLYEVLAGEYHKEAKTWFGRKWKLTRLNLSRGNYWELIVFIVSVSVGAFSLYEAGLSWVEELIAKGLAVLGISAALMSGLKKFYNENASKAKELLKKYTSRHSYTDVLGIQAEIQKEIKTLFKVWFKGNEERKVLLFVDDIDRCHEERIIEIVDALRVMLEDDKIYDHLIVVAAIDERILRRAIRLKYNHLLEGEGDKKERKLNDLTEEYMDKLFISGIRLGELMPSEKTEIFAALTDGQVDNISIASSYPDAAMSHESTEEQMDMMSIMPEEEMFDDNVLQLEEQAFEINNFEAEEINAGIAVLRNSTPRQIRIFYYRYILARNFVRDLKGLNRWGADVIEIKVLVHVIAYLTNADLMGKDVLEIIEGLPKDKSVEEDVQSYLAAMEEQQRGEFYKVLEMVVTY